MKSSVEWRRQNKEWGVYSRLVKTSDFISNPNANWLGVVAPSVAMKNTMKPWGWCYWRSIFPQFCPPLSSPVASVDNSVTCWQPPISITYSILLLWGFSLILGAQGQSSLKDWLFHASTGKLCVHENASQWKSTQALCLGYIILRYVTNHPQWYADGTEPNCPY